MTQMSDHDLAQIIWDYMRYEQQLEKADMIIGLGSADVRTAEWCAHLWKDGWAPRILFSGGRGRFSSDMFADNEADVYAERAIKLGVPNGVILRESEATNTGENIRYIAKLLHEQSGDIHTIIMVQKPYMLRRSYATFMKQWPSDMHRPHIIMSAINLTMDEYTANAYLSFQEIVAIMVGDLQRIIEYPKLGYQIAQDISEVVLAAYDELRRRGYTKHLL